MEWKIGEIFEYNGEWYQCVEGNCAYCSIEDEACEQRIINDVCKLNRIFKKLEKVGEPYKFQKRTIQTYKLYTEPFISFDMDFINTYLNGSDTIDIIIKQNIEDMEEKKLNLKPFDIQKAREGKPVCTRDGHKARIICFDYNGETGDYPIVALVHYNKGNKCYERVLKYTSDGFFNKYGDCQHNDDLMMSPEKKEGWVNIVRGSNGSPHMGRGIFTSKKKQEMLLRYLAIIL